MEQPYLVHVVVTQAGHRRFRITVAATGSLAAARATAEHLWRHLNGARLALPAGSPDRSEAERWLGRAA